MFLVGELKDSASAQKVVKTLSGVGISAHLEARDSGVIGLFVERESDVPKAMDHFRVAMGLPAPRELPKGFLAARKVPFGLVTKILLSVSIITYLLKLSPDHIWIIEKMFFDDPYEKEKFLLKIQEGEIWRLITPVFIHFNFIHIFFNGMWLFDLGRILENKLGKGKYIGFVALVGLLSNMGQFAMTGPLFGGMSGVVFGFLGYVWIIQIIDPDGPQILPKHDVVLMVVWFFLCLFGLIPSVANMAHALGLCGGIGFAYIQFFLTGKKIVNLKPHIIPLVFMITLPFLTFAIDYWRGGGRVYLMQFFGSS